MPLIKKVAWPWRDVTPFVSPRELASCALYVLVGLNVFIVVLDMKEGVADRQQKNV